MNKPKITKIYLDLDGVICDFSERYRELYKMHPKEADSQKKFYPFFLNFIENKNFETLELMAGSRMAIDFLNNLDIPTVILSSTVNEDLHLEISNQKLVWLRNNEVPFPAIFVPGKRHKKHHATPDSILIDDTESNCIQWVEAGGISIHHSDWMTTMDILRTHL
jgi:beta-phosphoglucomutase-like phosphatase (HAD superfamily)